MRQLGLANTNNLTQNVAEGRPAFTARPVHVACPCTARPVRLACTTSPYEGCEQNESMVIHVCRFESAAGLEKKEKEKDLFPSTISQHVLKYFRTC